MTTRTWDTTIPADNGYAGDGDDRIRDTKVDLKERLELDHYMDGELDPLEGDCDGYHRKATLYAQATDPTPLTGTGVIYTKVIDGVTELFFRDATTGTINQITENGVLSLNTLQNNIDANGKNITGAGTISGTTVTAGTLNVTTIAKTGTGVVTNLNADLLDGKHAPSGTIVGTSDTQTLTNKTLDGSCDVTNANKLGWVDPSGYVKKDECISGASISSVSAIGANILSKDNGASGITFHRPGIFAVNFGLDTDNQLSVGGFSMGSTKHVIATKTQTQTLTNKTLDDTNSIDFGCVQLRTITANGDSDNDVYDNNYSYIESDRNYRAAGVWKHGSDILWIYQFRRWVIDGQTSRFHLYGVNMSSGALDTIDIMNGGSTGNYGYIRIYNNL